MTKLNYVLVGILVGVLFGGGAFGPSVCRT